jgi:hypothetical protein
MRRCNTCPACKETKRNNLRKPEPCLNPLPPQHFLALIRIETDCEESFTQEQMRQWLHEQFQGCEVGQMGLIYLTEEDPEETNEV